MRILLVDNDAHTRAALSDFLAGQGHDVVAETSGSDALIRFRQQPFPLVILDQALVGMDGLDLLARIKAERQETIVIVTSNFPALAAVVRALRLNAFDYLLKSVDAFEQLHGTLLRAAAQIGQQQQQRADNNALHQRVNSLLEENRRLAVNHRDPATGLDETDQFMHRVEAEIDRSRRHQRRFAVVILRFNTQIEIGTGQYQVRALEGSLPLLVQKMRDRLRQSDILARYDERTLSLILPETGREGALLVAQSIAGLCSDIATALIGAASDIDGLLQVGVACFPDDGSDQAALVDQAFHGTTDIGSSSVH